MRWSAKPGACGLPAGDSELRFEGVTSGIVPQSAIVTGLGEAVLEKNRDARLLSPGALLDASLGERLTLAPHVAATGAGARAGGDRPRHRRRRRPADRGRVRGAALHRPSGNAARAARCRPACRPSRPCRCASAAREPVERDVTLSYITNNFDWQADYVADLSPDGRHARPVRLADAGQRRRDRARRRRRPRRSPASSTASGCGSRRARPGDHPQLLAVGHDQRHSAASADGGRRHCPRRSSSPACASPRRRRRRRRRRRGRARRRRWPSEERLGDVRLYRVPITVTVAAQSQKQVALLRQPAVKIESMLRLRPHQGPIDAPLERVLVTRNRPREGLGLPLPAGKVALFGQREGRRILLGEGRIDDHTDRREGRDPRRPRRPASARRQTHRRARATAGRACS